MQRRVVRSNIGYVFHQEERLVHLIRNDDCTKRAKPKAWETMRKISVVIYHGDDVSYKVYVHVTVEMMNYLEYRALWCCTQENGRCVTCLD